MKKIGMIFAGLALGLAVFYLLRGPSESKQVQLESSTQEVSGEPSPIADVSEGAGARSATARPFAASVDSAKLSGAGNPSSTVDPNDDDPERDADAIAKRNRDDEERELRAIRESTVLPLVQSSSLPPE